MARREEAREDLLAEATALVERAELLIPSEAEPIVVGFRRGGAASVYFGQDEAYHFDSAGRLRRAYLAGLLFKADRGRLASLERERTAGEVRLLRHDLTETETARFLDRLQSRLVALRTAAGAESVRWHREVPEGAAVRSKILQWLTAIADRIEVARSPRLG